VRTCSSSIFRSAPPLLVRPSLLHVSVSRYGALGRHWETEELMKKLEEQCQPGASTHSQLLAAQTIDCQHDLQDKYHLALIRKL
jgi:hypothetical protein